MTTEAQQTNAMDSQDEERSIPEFEEHSYRFEEGDQIADRYQVIKPLGFGGFAEVYLCQDTVLKRPMAVKVLKESDLGLEEARVAAPLKHPRIG